MATYTMQELELETAELLPARETLWCHTYSHPANSFTSAGFINTGPVLSGNALAVSVFGPATAVGGGNEGIAGIMG